VENSKQITQGIVLMLASLLLEICSTLYIRAVAAEDVLASAVLAFIGPFVSLPFLGYMIEAKTWKHRILLTTIYAVGYTAGSLISFLIF
jgi:hypothetical protein